MIKRYVEYFPHSFVCGGGCPKIKNQKDGHSKYGADIGFDTLDLASGEAEKSIFGQSGGVCKSVLQIKL